MRLCGDVPPKRRDSSLRKTVLDDIYGIDLMRDNVDLCKKRLGGGTILMGDSLNPENRIKEQTDTEHNELLKLFTNTVFV